MDGSILNHNDTVYGSSTNVNYCASVGSTLRSFGIKGNVGAQGEQGITTYGSESTQSFKYGSIGTIESEEHVMIIQLKGDIGQNKVVQPLFVKTKVKCEVCGCKNSSLSKFCGECGTNLSY
jgi:hypothetical protein